MAIVIKAIKFSLNITRLGEGDGGKMRLIHISSHLVWLALLLLFTMGSYCSRGMGHNQTIQGETQTKGASKITLSGDGKSAINEDGWEIPALASFNKRRTATLEEKTGDGKSVKINLTEYIQNPSAEVITEEPFKSISAGPDPSWKSIGSMSIIDLTEFDVNGNKFAYKLGVVRVALDTQRKVVERAGSVFPLMYYDEDGDGKFETLILEEQNSRGTNGFNIAPQIPQWVLQKH